MDILRFVETIEKCSELAKFRRQLYPFDARKLSTWNAIRQVEIHLDQEIKNLIDIADIRELVATTLRRLYELDVVTRKIPRVPSLLSAVDDWSRRIQPYWIFAPKRYDVRSIGNVFSELFNEIPANDKVVVQLVNPVSKIDSARDWVVYDFENITWSLQRGLCDACKGLLAISSFDDNVDYSATCDWPPQWAEAEIGIRDRMQPVRILNEVLDDSWLTKIVTEPKNWINAEIPIDDFAKMLREQIAEQSDPPKSPVGREFES